MSRRLLLAVLPLLAACHPSSSPPAGGGGPRLDGRTFLSTSITDGGKPRTLVGTDHLVLSFDEGARAGGSAGCNSFGGSYSITDGVLVLTNGAQTEIGCDPERHAQDEWYFGFLSSRPTIAVDANTLVLAGGSVRIEYLDQEVATPDLELVGPTWTVDTIVSGGTAQHAQWATPASLRLTADGKVQVGTGCNSGSGTYTVDGDRLTFSNVGVTERACADPMITALEAAVLGVVHGPQPVTWEIDVKRLSLRNASGGIDLVGNEG